MDLDEESLRKDLTMLGMKAIDAELLIKSAKNKGTSVSWQFLKSMAGLYVGTAWAIALYFFFIYYMDRKEFIAFTAIYLSVMFVTLFCTPMFKLFIFSAKVFRLLKGR